MNKYKFIQFNEIIENPTVSIEMVYDYILQKKCNVEILLEIENGSRYSVKLENFKYDITWEDVDILTWAENEIKKYQVE